MIRRQRLLLSGLGAALALTSACTVDTAALEPIDDYESWVRIDTVGKIPGHGDTYRVIYVNDVAAAYTGSGEYAVGSVLVKEVRALTADDGPGDLGYLAIMRKLGDDAEAPSGGTIDGGWLFTRAADVNAEEVAGLTCWNKCHAQAPFDGLWLDYGP